MKVQIRDRDALSSLTTLNLRSYLESQGWADGGFWGKRASIHAKEHGGRSWEVLVPLRDTASDYAESMAEAVAVLAAVEERSQLDVFRDLQGAGSAAGKGVGSMTSANELARLERVDDLRSVWPDEAQDFTPWLAQPENLAVLSEALNMELETEGQEERVGLFRADILCRDTQDDSLVLIENQLERTDHNHLGQLLTYAAGLQTVTIIWVARTFTDEHRAALDWLNEITDDRFRFFGLEIELWRIGDSPAAPKFNIVAKPNEWTRSTGQAAKGSSGVLTGANLQNQRFWEQLDAHLKAKNSPVKIALQGRDFRQGKHYIKTSIGESGFKVEALRMTAKTRPQNIHLKMTMSGDSHDEISAWLQQQNIQSEFAEPLQWRPTVRGKGSVLILSNDHADPNDESDWPNQVEWMANALEKFAGIFPPLIQEFAAGE